MKSRECVVVEGVKLTISQAGNLVNVCKVIGRDRQRGIDITSGQQFRLDDSAITLVEKMKAIAGLPTARCTCDYRYGYSDHAKHCQSIYVAEYDGSRFDDD